MLATTLQTNYCREVSSIYNFFSSTYWDVSNLLFLLIVGQCYAYPILDALEIMELLVEVFHIDCVVVASKTRQS